MREGQAPATDQSAAQELDELLTGIYGAMNCNLFNSELPDIQVQFTSGARYAGVTQVNNGEVTGILINADTIRGDSTEARADYLAGILLHEMVHVYCIINGIPHYIGGKHTPEFIEAAADHGLFYDDFGNTNFLMADINEIL